MAEETYPELKQKYDHLVRQMAALNEAAQKFDRLYRGALEEISLLNARLVAAQQAVDIQKGVVRNYLTGENAKAQETYVELAALHAENKKLRLQLKALEVA